MRNRVRWEIEDKGREREREQEKVYFLSTDLNTKGIPPWATGKDSYRGNRFLPAALWMASPWGLSHVIISKLLLSSPWAEAQPSTHADTQSLVFFPEETERTTERAALHAHMDNPSLESQSKCQTFHSQGTLGTFIRGQRQQPWYCEWP